jgi:hypothetical protein
MILPIMTVFSATTHHNFQYLVHVYFLFAEFFIFLSNYMLYLLDIDTDLCHGGLYCVTHFQIYRISTSYFPTTIGRRHMFSVEDPILNLYKKLA